MADGRDDRFALPATRGMKLRCCGSNPTGDQTMSFTPKYSGELKETGRGPLFKRDLVNEDNYNQTSSDEDCCQDLGLNMKEPLS